MGRSEKNRSLISPPRFFRFVAEESPIQAGKTIEMPLDEYESLRLSDQLGYNHEEASRIMNISRPTYISLLNRTRKKMTDFLIEGGPLEIRGGRVLFVSDFFCCKNCHRPFKKTGDEMNCPRCNGTNIIKAKPSCHQDCPCFEEADKLIVT